MYTGFYLNIPINHKGIKPYGKYWDNVVPMEYNGSTFFLDTFTSYIYMSSTPNSDNVSFKQKVLLKKGLTPLLYLDEFLLNRQKNNLFSQQLFSMISYFIDHDTKRFKYPFDEHIIYLSTVMVPQSENKNLHYFIHEVEIFSRSHTKIYELIFKDFNLFNCIAPENTIKDSDLDYLVKDLNEFSANPKNIISVLNTCNK